MLMSEPKPATVLSTIKKTMTTYSVLTYATHAEGLFPALQRAVPGLEVGGWGQPWEGFLQKFAWVAAATQHLPDDHVVIFVDGFDTEARLPAWEAVRRFRARGVPFLCASLGMELQLPPFLARRVFSCSDQICVNSGLYMGVASAVRQVLGVALQRETNDDQRALEMARDLLPGVVHVDDECTIFHNLNARERRACPRGVRAVFVGHNGSGILKELGRPQAGCWRLRHFASALSHEAMLLLLAAVLGVCWQRLGGPPCINALFCGGLLLFFLYEPVPDLAAVYCALVATVGMGSYNLSSCL